MKRRALLIYCDNTSSGELIGPVFDNQNFREFLLSRLGGDWKNTEIVSLRNPTFFFLRSHVRDFFRDADYTFTLFSGHGFINADDNFRQYIELSDRSIPVRYLRSTARRQTLIIDACRGFYSPSKELLKGFGEHFEEFMGDIYDSTRHLFDQAVLMAEEGWTILFAASKNQTALDTNKGGAYLLSLLKSAEIWQDVDNQHEILGLDFAHEIAKRVIYDDFDTIQQPTMNREKRMRYFPFAVKFANL